MAYATAAEFAARYTTRVTESDLSSHFLPFASGRLDALLGPFYTVPFSVNNLTARDLTIDLAYLLILQRSREPKESAPLNARIRTSLRGLAEGSEAMVTTSGDLLFGSGGGGLVWSNTAADTPIFALGDADAEVCP